MPGCLADDIAKIMLNGFVDSLVDWRRPLNLAGFAVCAALLLTVYYLQFQQGLEPCPLCIFQRVGFFVLGVAFLSAGLHAPRQSGGRVYAVLLLTIAIAGSALAGRHIWIQSLPPDQVPACGPGLSYMLEILPLWEAVRMVLQGSGECAQVDRLLGVSIPIWSLAGFVGLGVVGVLVNWGRQQSRPPGTSR